MVECIKTVDPLCKVGRDFAGICCGSENGGEKEHHGHGCGDSSQLCRGACNNAEPKPASAGQTACREQIGMDLSWLLNSLHVTSVVSGSARDSLFGTFEWPSSNLDMT